MAPPSESFVQNKFFHSIADVRERAVSSLYSKVILSGLQPIGSLCANDLARALCHNISCDRCHIVSWIEFFFFSCSPQSPHLECGSSMRIQYLKYCAWYLRSHLITTVVLRHFENGNLPRKLSCKTQDTVSQLLILRFIEFLKFPHINFVELLYSSLLVAW